VKGIIEQVCIGMPQTVHHAGKDVLTGIFKSPVVDRVRVRVSGIDGDGQADLGVHGGRDKAVYVYPYDHYPGWAETMGVDALGPSQFGENLMVAGIDESSVHIGDRFRFGGVTAIVTQPRLPCYKLGIRTGDDGFPAIFLRSGKLGFYLRVETEGETGPADRFERIGIAEHGITVTALWQTVFGKQADKDTLVNAARCIELMPHLDDGWRRRLLARAGR